MTDTEYIDRLVDRTALSAYLHREFGSADRFDIAHHPAGHSNETLFVTWGDRELVIRRPPPGETADTAHDVLREYRVIEALSESDVPTPDALGACRDHAVLGCDFYVMERVEGDVLRTSEPPRFASPTHRAQIGAALVTTLATIHEVDVEAVGLSDFGRPAGYTERQVDRWTRQIEWAFETTQAKRAVPALVSVGDWLTEHVPATHHETMVHGDFKMDNVMFGPGAPPEVVAVFDWELSTLGDPLSDLGWLLLFWQDEGDPPVPMPELMATFMAREGYPTRDDLTGRYEAVTGRPFVHERFYRVLAAYKMAALGEMFLARHLNGDANDPLYPKMEAYVPELARRTLAFVDGETTHL